MNECLARKMSRTTVAKDTYRYEAQVDMANSLTLTIALLSRLNEETVSIDAEEFKTFLADSAKFQANAIFKESVSRRAFVTPGFKEVRSILEKAETDNSWLFGSKLEKALEGNELVNPQTQVLRQLTNAIQQNKSTFLGKRKGPESRYGQQQGNFSAARGKPGTRLFLRGKNDFRNPRANQARPKEFNAGQSKRRNTHK